MLNPAKRLSPYQFLCVLLLVFVASDLRGIDSYDVGCEDIPRPVNNFEF